MCWFFFCFSFIRSFGEIAIIYITQFTFFYGAQTVHRASMQLKTDCNIWNFLIILSFLSACMYALFPFCTYTVWLHFSCGISSNITQLSALTLSLSNSILWAICTLYSCRQTWTHTYLLTVVEREKLQSASHRVIAFT